MTTTTDNGYRSGCCYAPIRLGKKALKNSKLKKSVWVCTKCGKRDVSIIEYIKNGKPVSTQPFAELVDTVDEAVLESDVEIV